MNFIEPADVNNENITELLSSAGMVAQLEDDANIYIKEGIAFPSWVSIDEEKKCIRIHTWVMCKDDAPLEQLDEFVSFLNSKYFLTQFSGTKYEDGRAYINGHYYLFYNFGIIPGQLTHTIRKFSDIFIGAIRDEDKDDVFVG